MSNTNPTQLKQLLPNLPKLKPALPTTTGGGNPFLQPSTNHIWSSNPSIGKNQPLKNPLFVGYNKKDNTPIYAGSRLFVLV
ncbi:MAG: hypothetical protein KC475_07035 [Cyanobacteria bacterium HKST-UBA03]|nr:hypothetical protein [Cyanobacteria bacterium HKST-UBA03]